MTRITKAIAGTAAALLVGLTAYEIPKRWSWADVVGRQSTLPATPDVKPFTVAKVNRWLVRYEDAELGIVEGEALVNWAYHTARVRLKNPTNSEITELTSEDVKIDDADSTVTMNLVGESPGTVS